MANKDAQHGEGALTQEELDNLSEELGFRIDSVEGKKYPSSIMLYGEAKVGKTQLAGSISEVPGYERVLVIDAELGTSTLAHTYPNVKFVSIAPTVRLDGSLDHSVTIKKLNRLLAAFADPEGTMLKSFDVVIFDTVDTIQTSMIEYFIEQTPQKQATYSVWGLVKKKTLELLWAFHRLPILAIFNFHQQLAEDDTSGKSVITPSMATSARDQAASVPDIIAHLSVEEDNGVRHRILEVLPSGRRRGGNRFESLLNEPIGNPTMAKIYRRLDG